MNTTTFRKSPLFRLIALTVLTAFAGLLPAQPSDAQVAIFMPQPGQMIHVTQHYEPPQMVGIKIDLKDPFSFDFIMDQGETPMSDNVERAEFNKIIKYFLVSLAMPNKQMWVNLSPYESQRIIPEVFAQTNMGRDLLAQDYVLKQFTASLMYPENGLGKKFWDKVYQEAQARFGTTDIDVDTFNKVWIVADHADIYQKDNTAFLVDSHLKVMLEQDYMAIEKNKKIFGSSQAVNEYQSSDDKTKMASQLVREIIIPAIEKEVNEGKSFAAVRQVYNAEILATWYKKALKASLLGQVFANKSKIAGQRISDPKAEEKIYEQYLAAYKKGVFNYVREDQTPDGQTVPRKYFSGGMDEVDPAMITELKDASSPEIKRFQRSGISRVKRFVLASVLFVSLAGAVFSASAGQVQKGAELMRTRSQLNLTGMQTTQTHVVSTFKPVEWHGAKQLTSEAILKDMHAKAASKQAASKPSAEVSGHPSGTLDGTAPVVKAPKVPVPPKVIPVHPNETPPLVKGPPVHLTPSIDHTQAAVAHVVPITPSVAPEINHTPPPTTPVHGNTGGGAGGGAGAAITFNLLTGFLANLDQDQGHLLASQDTIHGMQDQVSKILEQNNPGQQNYSIAFDLSSNLTAQLHIKKVALGDYQLNLGSAQRTAADEKAKAAYEEERLKSSNSQTKAKLQELESNPAPTNLDSANIDALGKQVVINDDLITGNHQVAGNAQILMDEKPLQDQLNALGNGVDTEINIINKIKTVLADITGYVSDYKYWLSGIGSATVTIGFGWAWAIVIRKKRKELLEAEISQGESELRELDHDLKVEGDATGKQAADVPGPMAKAADALKNLADSVARVDAKEQKAAVTPAPQQAAPAASPKPAVALAQPTPPPAAVAAPTPPPAATSTPPSAAPVGLVKESNIISERIFALSKRLGDTTIDPDLQGKMRDRMALLQQYQVIIIKRERLTEDKITINKKIEDEIKILPAALTLRFTKAFRDASGLSDFFQSCYDLIKAKTGYDDPKGPQIIEGVYVKIATTPLGRVMSGDELEDDQRAELYRGLVELTKEQIRKKYFQRLEKVKLEFTEVQTLLGKMENENITIKDPSQDMAQVVGGINLSDENLTINIKVDGAGMPLLAQYQDNAMLNLKGLTSIIRKISPLTPQNVPAFFELVK